MRRVDQTPNPVLELEYLRPVNSNGRRLDRSIILHFLSMGEFVDAVLQDDFELGVSLGVPEFLFNFFFFSEKVQSSTCCTFAYCWLLFSAAPIPLSPISRRVHPLPDLA